MMVRSTSFYGVWVGGSRYHGQRPRGAQGALACVWLMMSGLCAQAESVKPLSEFKDTIIARAEQAWESDDGEVMFIRGAATVLLIALYVAWRGGGPAIRVRAWRGQLARAGWRYR